MIKKKTSDALSRSDTVLIAALAIVLATASAAIGSAMTYQPANARAVAATTLASAPSSMKAQAIPAANLPSPAMAN
jgi:hypothetical protein